MFQLLLVLLIAPLTYQEAFQRSQATGALVVMIEGENCPACKVQENNLRLAGVEYHKTCDASRWPGLPTLRPLTLIYWREGIEWKLQLLKGSIDVDRLRMITKQRTKIDM